MRRCLLVLSLLVGLALCGTGTAGAQGAVAGVDIVKVTGVIDPTVGRYVRDVVAGAERSGSVVVLQIDSPGTYGDEALHLARFLRDSIVPVVAWVGPSGARAQGGALFLLAAASLSSMAPGAGVGPLAPFDLRSTASGESREDREAGVRVLHALGWSGSEDEAVRRMLAGDVLSAREAMDAGIVDVAAPQGPGGAGVVGLLRAIDGRRVETATGQVTLDTVGTTDRSLDVRFHDLGPLRRVLHAVSTPTALYLLVVLALWGIAFEFTQPGFGMAGIAGVLALGLAVYALTVVPVGWAGLVLLVAGTGLQGLDVMLRRLGPLTIGGTVGFAAGSVLAWRGVAPAIDVSPWLIGLATVAGLVLFGFGMTVALRARERIRSQQVGLVGLVGEARADLDPEGAVFVKGTLWRARSNDGPIPKGARIRVRGLDGLILRVEPDPGHD